MIHSRAFEAIEDPADPAWSGHAPAAPSRLRRRAGMIALAVAALALAAAAMVVVASRSTGNDASATPGVAAANAATQPAPLEAAGQVVEVPQDAPVTPAAPTGDDDAATPADAGATVDASSGSGWAPPDVTRPAYSPARLRGDTSGISSLLTSRLDAVARDLGSPIRVESGWRTNHEQANLYQQYLAGTGNLAAVPGTSLHEVGRAADVYVGDTPLASVPGAVKIARGYGLHFPVAGEAWHVELIGDPQGSGR
ncbi:MAG: M15 family metallopeptidase [Thermoleophilia bacterium]|nr:M15 family metallopeptidase [Thermoleophilia bacterium]